MSERILFDEARDARIGLPEAVFSEGKDPESLKELLLRFRRGCGHPILFTRLSAKALEALPEDVRGGYSYDPISRTAYGERLPERGEEYGSVAIVTAGTSDSVVIVCAGLDAAIASVLGGLTGRPLIAVPTSVGYGAARGGETALHSMLCSCAPGVAVMNIDNGYGAACAAVRILNSRA